MLTLYFVIFFLLLAFLAIALVPLIAYAKKPGFEKPRIDVCVFSIAIVVASILAVFLYHAWGSSQSLAKFYAMSEVASITNKKFTGKDVQQVSEKLVNYLSAHPKDAKGWYLLGRLYLDQKNTEKAVEAFKQSFANDSQNVEIMAQYAQALYFHQNRLTDQTMHLIQMILSQDPQNITALNLLAVDAFTHHRYEMAVTYWKRLRNQYPEGSQEFNSLTQAINIAESRSKKV